MNQAIKLGKINIIFTMDRILKKVILDFGTPKSIGELK